MKKYYLGIASNREAASKALKEYFWCLPLEAAIGDSVLLYCPRAASQTRQGIFAEGLVITKPDKVCDSNYFCSGYGAYGAKYFYVKLEIIRRFKPHVVAADMKADRLLSGAGFVRRNFQGTTFQLENEQYQRLLVIADRKLKAIAIA